MICKMKYDQWNVLNILMHSIKCSDNYTIRRRVFASDLADKIGEKIHQYMDYQKRLKLALSEDEVIGILKSIDEALLDDGFTFTLSAKIDLDIIKDYLSALLRVHSWETDRV